MKKLNKLTAVAATILIILALAACSNASSGGGSGSDTKDKKQNDTTKATENGYTLNHDDGDPLAMFLCESLCDNDDETVRLCFYADGSVKLRATSLDKDEDEYGKRYDKIRGTYTGNPAIDGKIEIDFKEECHGYGHKYKPYEREADLTAYITRDVLRFKNGDFAYGTFHDYNFVRTTSDDFGPYFHQGVSKRQNDNRLTEWTIPEGYSSVGSGCFFDGEALGYYKYLKKVTLPSTIKKIGSSAFLNCTSLEEIKIPEGCTEIDGRAFYDCTSLKELILPSTIKTLGDFSLQDLEVPVRIAEGVEKFDEIGSNAFSYMKELEIPSTLKQITNITIDFTSIKTIKSNGTLYDLFSFIGENSCSYTKLICNNKDCSEYVSLSLDYRLYAYQWEEAGKSDGMLLTFKKNKTYIKKTAAGTEKGLWSTDNTTGHKITLYPDNGNSVTYDYHYEYNSYESAGNQYTLTITDLAEFNEVTEFKVVEKQKTTSDKWCENAAKGEDGKYIYYQYYIEKAPGYFVKYIDTPLSYGNKDENFYVYYHEDRYYKSCKQKIEELLKNSSSIHNYSDRSELDLAEDPQK